MARFVAQPFRHVIQRAEVLIRAHHIEIAGAAERIQPAGARRRGTEGSPGHRPAPYRLLPDWRYAFFRGQRTLPLIIGIIIGR